MRKVQVRYEEGTGKVGGRYEEGRDVSQRALPSSSSDYVMGGWMILSQHPAPRIPPPAPSFTHEVAGSRGGDRVAKNTTEEV